MSAARVEAGLDRAGGAGRRLEGARAAGGRGLRRATPRCCGAAARCTSAATAAAPPTRSTWPPSTWCATPRTRRALAAVALTTDTSLLTAAGNDLGFEQIFARQVEALCRPGDLLVLHSTSGRSPNLVAAARRRANARHADRGLSWAETAGRWRGWWTRPWWCLPTTRGRSRSCISRSSISSSSWSSRPARRG